MRGLLWKGSALAVAVASLAGAALAGQEGGGFTRAFRKASESLVLVRATLPVKSLPVPLSADQATFCNTGFFVDGEGSVLTSLLAVAGCSELTVLTPDGQRSEARLGAVDQPAGLAFLKTGLKGTTPLQLARSAPAAGSWLLFAYCAEGPGGAVPLLQPTMAAYLPGRARFAGLEWGGLMAVSVRVCSGCAAAPVLDREGLLAGVVLGARRDQGGLDALVLPADQLGPVLERLSAGRSRRLGWLGLSVLSEDGRREGVRVGAVLDRSPAYSAGVRPGDVLLQVGEHAISGPVDLIESLCRAGPGADVELKLLRGSSIRTVRLEVGARPLLICGATPRPGGGFDLARLGSSTRSSSWSFQGSRTALLRGLLEQNRRLRLRLEELERRCGYGRALPRPSQGLRSRASSCIIPIAPGAESDHVVSGLPRGDARARVRAGRGGLLPRLRRRLAGLGGTGAGRGTRGRSARRAPVRS